jgi:hypothetical protein
MPKISWTINLDGQTNVIELDHGMWSGKRIIYANGVQVHRSNKFFDSGTSEHQFQIGPNKCRIVIRVVMGITYNLFVNDQAEREQRFTYSQLLNTQPWWAWLLSFIPAFFYGLGLIAIFEAAEDLPIDFPRLLLFTILVFAGDILIWVISSDRTRSIWLRFLLCLSISVILSIFLFIQSCSCFIRG